MSSPPVESQAWPRRRWAGVTALILAMQVALVFWLSARKVETPRPTAAGPALYLPKDQTTDLPGVSDPTLFVLPNGHGFSGSAWLQFPPMNYELEPWTEPIRPLELLIPQLGATLTEYARTNRPRAFELALKPPPESESPAYFTIASDVMTQSTFSIEGELADRPLLTPLRPDFWAASEILTNTEVQIAVDAAGRVFSAALLVKCASAEANASALSLASSARFQPLRWVGIRPPPAAPDGLSWGKMVFHWHTVAPPTTNAAALNK